jgi:hypothetical protein
MVNTPKLLVRPSRGRNAAIWHCRRGLRKVTCRAVYWRVLTPLPGPRVQKGRGEVAVSCLPTPMSYDQSNFNLPENMSHPQTPQEQSSNPVPEWPELDPQPYPHPHDIFARASIEFDQPPIVPSQQPTSHEQLRQLQPSTPQVPPPQIHLTDISQSGPAQQPSAPQMQRTSSAGPIRSTHHNRRVNQYEHTIPGSVNTSRRTSRPRAIQTAVGPSRARHHSPNTGSFPLSAIRYATSSRVSFRVI